MLDLFEGLGARGLACRGFRGVGAAFRAWASGLETHGLWRVTKIRRPGLCFGVKFDTSIVVQGFGLRAWSLTYSLMVRLQYGCGGSASKLQGVPPSRGLRFGFGM